MKIFLHNTLTGKKEAFEPIDKVGNVVGMYNCGPTVYNFAHIGNLRAYVFADVLRRTLELNGYKVKQIINITDVGHLSGDTDDGEDKMSKALKREGKTMTLEAMKDVGSFYAERFVEDLKALNIEAANEYPTNFPKASDHIEEDIEIIKKIEEKGAAYKTSDGVYFDTSKFKDYGKLGNINLEGLQEGARVSANSEKKNPTDFNLWKFSTNDLGWPSPWGLPERGSQSGKGFPGWHIECSAMSVKYLGQPFDIHTGGIDHIPTHHNNEIAQSETAYGKPLANLWMHSAFVNVNGGKMAKSEDNFLRLKTLTDKGISPLAYRYFLLGAHYKTPINFSFEAMEGAKNSYDKLIGQFGALSGSGGVANQKYLESFKSFVNDDLNTPKALALLWEALKDNTLTDADKISTIFDFDKVLGLDIWKESGRVKNFEVPDEIKKLADEREYARQSKDFKKSDELRKQIESLNYEIQDTDSGPVIKKK
ncbi:MAG: cysteine--tRNA ligase [Candidatus Paceibacterota bacterium]